MARSLSRGARKAGRATVKAGRATKRAIGKGAGRVKRATSSSSSRSRSSSASSSSVSRDTRSYSSGPGYVGTREYWTGRGRGHNLAWVNRYPWFWSVFQPYALVWYPPVPWIPQYTVPESATTQVTNVTLVVDSANFSDSLATLPTFEERGIDLGAMEALPSDQTALADPAQSAVAQETIELVDAELKKVRNENLTLRLEQQGYNIVPDMDTGRFAWIRKRQAPSNKPSDFTTVYRK